FLFVVPHHILVGIVDGMEAGIQICHREHDGLILIDSPPPLLALPQRLFCLFPLRDVNEGYDRSEGSTIPKYRMGPKLYRKAGTVLSPINLIVSMDTLTFLKTYVNGAFLDRIRCPVYPSVVLQRMHVFPEQFSRIVVSEQARSCTITEKTGTLGIATKDRFSGRIEYEPD